MLTHSSVLLTLPARRLAFAAGSHGSNHVLRCSDCIVGPSASIPALPCPHSPFTPGMLEAADAEGVTVQQALEQAGFDPSPAALRSAAVRREQVCVGWQAPMYKLLRGAACARPLLLPRCAGMPALPNARTFICFRCLHSPLRPPLPAVASVRGSPLGARSCAGGSRPAPGRGGSHRRPVAAAGRDCGRAGSLGAATSFDAQCASSS